MNLYCNLTVKLGAVCVGQVGGIEAALAGVVEPLLKYHPGCSGLLTQARYPGRGHCLVGSLTGAVASQKVTEARKGALRLIGNQPKSAKAQGRLTARPTGRAGAKAGLSDPVVPYGRAIAQRIKGTLGITG
eukprot:TRINITY_DN18003_c0_g2_i1.p3 TRINITY_DN18003_c0_g2~~TRINITY_DN18003_c0_g2_i1.p3  ORF type:complete len:131 (-),score=4.26 TRINITY_DN18003_c0_g2_i1:19-411(-)